MNEIVWLRLCKHIDLTPFRLVKIHRRERKCSHFIEINSGWSLGTQLIHLCFFFRQQMAVITRTTNTTTMLVSERKCREQPKKSYPRHKITDGTSMSWYFFWAVVRAWISLFFLWFSVAIPFFLRLVFQFRICEAKRGYRPKRPNVKYTMIYANSHVFVFRPFYFFFSFFISSFHLHFLCTYSQVFRYLTIFFRAFHMTDRRKKNRNGKFSEERKNENVERSEQGNEDDTYI